MVFILLTIILIGSYSVLMLYYRRSWIQMPEFEAGEREVKLPFVSVIIAARNEEKNISNCLQSLLKQDYSTDHFQVIVVDDHSDDETVIVVKSFINHFSNLQLISLAEITGGDKLNSYKKKAIETGVEQASGEIIITTDADCILPPKWISTIIAFWQKSAFEMMAAPVVFLQRAKINFFKKLFSIFQTLDFMSLQGITGASLYRQFLYMANGANLAYTKKIFKEVNGFAGVDHLASGDDMFLMDKIKTHHPQKIRYLKSRDAIVSTFPEETIGTFINQRIRWASKSTAYHDYKIKLVLALVYLLNVWLLILFVASFFSKSMIVVFLIAIGIKFIVELFFLFPVSRFFGQQKLLWWFIPAQPFHILYTVSAGFLGLFGSYKWKGRKVK